MSSANALVARLVGLPASIVAIILVSAIWLIPNASLGQTTVQQRTPSVIGCVVDNDPISHTANGNSVESGPLIGHINGTERRAVMEFDLSGLVPGQVDAARLTGRIGPNNSADTGVRRHDFYIGTGDGVLDVSDNITAGSNNIGWFQHNSGARTDFDFSLTNDFRKLMLQKPSFLRTQICPGNDPQGWDALYSDFPTPQLALTVRPVTASTVVYYQRPVAVGAAAAQGDGAFTINTAATSADVMNWNYDPYKKGRGLMEFDVGSIPKGAHVKWAKLDGFINGLQNSGYGTIGPDLQLVGYLGDGRVSLDDLLQSGTVIGSSGELNSTGSFSWTLDASFVEDLVASGGHLGLRFQPGIEETLRAQIVLDDGVDSGWTPRLAIAYEVPEPGTIALLAVGAGALLGHRWRKSRVAG